MLSFVAKLEHSKLLSIQPLRW